MSRASKHPINGPPPERQFPATTAFVTQRDNCRLPGSNGGFFGSCRNIEDYVKGQKVGEGTYGVVYRVKESHQENGPDYAVKRIRMDNDNDGFPIPSIREVSLLRQLKHKNVVRVQEVVVGSKLDHTFMLMEFCDRDLATMLDRLPEPLAPREVQCLMRQLLEGMMYLHNNFVIHRDLKLANLLLNHEGILKIADFGLARKFGLPAKPMTPRVVTLWYRAPELLLGEKLYTIAIDNWSIGCIFGELVINAPLVPGKTEMDQIDLIFQLIGSPTEEAWPEWTQLPQAKVLSLPTDIPSNLSVKFERLEAPGFDLLQSFLTYNPAQRMTTARALNHRYFRDAPLGEHVLLQNRHIYAQMEQSRGSFPGPPPIGAAGGPAGGPVGPGGPHGGGGPYRGHEPKRRRKM
ncbi:CMGC/CDK protein kinase [Allomyces macrogynus ATCC 38327]|uniref:CMGC/CDK protein kinase n=1 Tax=Allomyces macrogynus (strain ATCC 38327) TaxID=578462 RepID=A0A0L0SAZ7_ALLM3|nr:CMGC/CDK protein kinase [Allomyces macrogynus ATCC 38327]|eukprot:KNE59560.1 CMGC/CDK protein kinase [Allomyces macrogynus ATCC 38327]